MPTTKKPNSALLYLGPIVGFLIFVFITHDIIMTNILATYHCSQDPKPKTKISKKVEYPESIYWEDNVYPGFSKEDRELMIINYLDGKHLKTMALNGEDGNIYVYEAKEGEFDAFTYDKKFKDRYKQYAYKVMQNEKVYTKETMPKLNYNVTFNEIKFSSFASKFLYSDETKIIENNTSSVIAYNRRYMRFYYKLQPDFQGGNYYYIEPMCGKRMDMEQEVFSSYGWSTVHLGNHSRDLDKILINRHKKGEK